ALPHVPAPPAGTPPVPGSHPAPTRRPRGGGGEGGRRGPGIPAELARVVFRRGRPGELCAARGEGRQTVPRGARGEGARVRRPDPAPALRYRPTGRRGPQRREGPGPLPGPPAAPTGRRPRAGGAAGQGSAGALAQGRRLLDHAGGGTVPDGKVGG